MLFLNLTEYQVNDKKFSLSCRYEKGSENKLFALANFDDREVVITSVFEQAPPFVGICTIYPCSQFVCHIIGDYCS